MKKRNAATVIALTATLLLQPFGIDGLQADAATQRMVADTDLSETDVAEPDAWGATPNEAQRYYQTRGLSAFCHFGPNTFQNVEWGENYGDTPPSELFTLSQDFDADTIVKTIKDAGFSRLLITAKHHDGFCIWASEYTDYDISSTNYKNGKGDILEEISDACTKYNLDMGLYLSPWDIHEDRYGCYGDSKEGDYNELYTNEIREICTAKKEDGSYKYGNNNPNRRTERFVEWWMDGATGSGSSFQTYDWPAIFKAIRDTNPNCQIFGTHKAGVTEDGVKLGGTGGIHWIGNEDGYAHDETWSKINAGENFEDLRKDGYIKGLADGNTWSVPECDTKMLSSGWFWSQSKQNSLRSMSNLADIYFRSVGHGATLLLNVSPNTDGTLDENQKQRVLDFGQEVRDSFANDLTKNAGVTASATSVWGNSKAYSPTNVLDAIPEGETYDETYWAAADGETTGTLEIRFPNPVTFNAVSIEEYIPKGQKISSFSVECQSKGLWKPFAQGATIGSKRLCRGTEVTADAIRIQILDAKSVPMISNVGVFQTTDAFSLGEAAEEVPTNLKRIPTSQFQLKGEWGNDELPDGTKGNWSNLEKKGVAEFTFTGTKAWIYGTKDPGHGTMNVSIDGKEAVEVDTKGSVRKLATHLYTTPDLDYGEHTVRMEITKSAVGLAWADYQDGSGIFEMALDTYDVLESESVNVKIVRRLGSKGEAAVTYSTPSGGAEQGVNYVYQNKEIRFADGETEKEITLQTTYSPNIADGLTFYFTIDSVEGASLGTNRSSVIVISDKDYAANTKQDMTETVTEANSYLTEGQGAYSASAWQSFQAALDAAKKAQEDPATKPSVLAELQKELEKAISLLAKQKLSAYVSGLNVLYEAGPANYTKESWTAFQAAFLAAKSPKDDATLDELNALLKNLELAQSKLAPSQPPSLAAPAITKLQSSLQGVKLTFAASENSASYEIYRAQGKGQPVKIGDANGTSFTDQKPVGGKKLTYMVKAISNDEKSFASSGFGDSKSVTLPTAAKKITAKAATKGVLITVWPAKKITKYVLLRSSSKNGPYKKLKTFTMKKKMNITDKTAKRGKKYFYRIISVKGKAYSPAKTSKRAFCKK